MWLTGLGFLSKPNQLCLSSKHRRNVRRRSSGETQASGEAAEKTTRVDGGSG